MLDRSVDGGDRAPSRQPIFNIPAPVLVVLGILVGIQFARQIIPDTWDDALFLHLAFVPGRITFAVEPQRVMDAVAAWAAQGSEGYRRAQLARFFLGGGSAEIWTVLTYALLHAGWAHVGLNGVWLLAFGTPIARRVGTWRFLVFLAVTAVAGALTQYAAHPLDFEPVVGASAAVSGCMGAALRFMFQPDTPVVAAMEGRGPARVPPAQPLTAVLTDRRALIFLVAWFATNLLFGLGSITFGAGEGPIAWEAHIGGFLAGMLLFRFFDPPAVPEAEAAPPPSAPDEPAPGF